MHDSAVTLSHIVHNKSNLYEGDLVHYMRGIFFEAQNLALPYHNFRHMFHVLWVCHDALDYYRAIEKPIDRLKARHFVLGAMHHDANHLGVFGDDDLNIIRAQRFFKAHALPEDQPHLLEIDNHIKLATQYPHIVPHTMLNLCGQILRDADMTQVFSVAWIQQTVFGLGAEWRKSPLEMLQKQEEFLQKLEFHTDWAKWRFPQSVIDAKIQEVRELLDILGK